MADCFLNSSKHFVPLEDGILLFTAKFYYGEQEWEKAEVFSSEQEIGDSERCSSCQDCKFSPSFAAFRATSADLGYKKSLMIFKLTNPDE